MLRLVVLVFAVVACSPQPTEPPPPPTPEPAPLPLAPKREPGPKCKELFGGYSKLCQAPALAQPLCEKEMPALMAKLRDEADEEVCAKTTKDMIPTVKAATGTSPWGPVEGEAKLPQTYSPNKLPENFVAKDDGFKQEVLEPAAPFLAASTAVIYPLGGLRTPDGKPDGFRVFFFEYASDLELAAKATQMGEFVWAFTKNNALFVLPSALSVAGSEEFTTIFAEKLKISPVAQPGSLPLAVDTKDLAKEYKSNEIKADAKYKGKLVRGTGTVNRIQRGIDGVTNLWFKEGPLSLFDAKCGFPKERESELIVIDAGFTAFVEGTVEGKTGLEVSLSNCRLIGYAEPKKK
jgi:hypothetical protein